MRNHRIWIAIAVLAHLLVNVFHGRGHTSLGVGLSAWQQFYVLTVVLLAPLVALGLSFTRYTKAALWLLLVSMLGAFVFGGLYHYVIISPDNVSHLPPGDARGMFHITALLLLVSEAFGALVGAIGLGRRVASQ